MKIVVAIDSLKGSLTSLEAGNTIKQGITKVMPDSQGSCPPFGRWWRRFERPCGNF